MMNIYINKSINILNQHPMMNICINKSINILKLHWCYPRRYAVWPIQWTGWILMSDGLLIKDEELMFQNRTLNEHCESFRI